MQDMRYIEIFSNGCRYFQFRVPALNRDMAFSKEASDLFVVGDRLVYLYMKKLN